MKSNPLILLCATGLFAVFSSTISKSPVLPLFAAHLGAGPSGVGLVAGVSAFTGIVASIPGGILSDRWGRKKMLMASAVVFGTAPFLYLFTREIWQLMLVRLYHGVATAVFIPVSMAFIADMYRDGRGERLGWFSSSTLAGRFVAPAAGGAIIAAFVLHPEKGYDAVYLLCGAAGVLVFFLALRMPCPEKPEKAVQDWHETLRIFRAAIAGKGILLTSGVEAAMLFSYGAFETFLPLHALRSGLSAWEVGFLLSAQVITVATVKPVAGRFSDRHGRRLQIVIGALMTAVAIAAVPFFGTFPSLMAASIVFGLCLSVVTSATSALIADISRREAYGSAMGIFGSVMDIGHTSGPIAVGVTAAYFGFGPAFLGAGIIVAGTALCFGFSRAGRHSAPGA